MAMRLYIADVSPLEDIEIYNRIYDSLPAFRKEKADKYKGSLPRYLSVGAGYLLRQAFIDEGIEEKLDEIYEDSLGKPQIDGDTYFNLSHSGKRAICAIGSMRLGADIQVMDRDNAEVAKRFFSKEENDYVFELNDRENIKKRFYQIWTMKEAYTKMTGDGIRKDFSKFNVLNKGLNFWNKRIEDYCISICTQDKLYEVEYIEIDLAE